jgi:hypothetical protein
VLTVWPSTGRQPETSKSQHCPRLHIAQTEVPRLSGTLQGQFKRPPSPPQCVLSKGISIHIVIICFFGIRSKRNTQISPGAQEHICSCVSREGAETRACHCKGRTQDQQKGTAVINTDGQSSETPGAMNHTLQTHARVSLQHFSFAYAPDVILFNSVPPKLLVYN